MSRYESMRNHQMTETGMVAIKVKATSFRRAIGALDESDGFV